MSQEVLKLGSVPINFSKFGWLFLATWYLLALKMGWRVHEKKALSGNIHYFLHWIWPEMLQEQCYFSKSNPSPNSKMQWLEKTQGLMLFPLAQLHFHWLQWSWLRLSLPSSCDSIQLDFRVRTGGQSEVVPRGMSYFIRASSTHPVNGF